MSTEHTTFEIDGALATLTFNRPEARNAMTWDMYHALVAACDRVDAEPAFACSSCAAPAARRSFPAPTSRNSRTFTIETTASSTRSGWITCWIGSNG